jgi:hypothetical protein
MYNYPNPFKSSTVINYSIPIEGSVSIEVLGQTGQILRKVDAGYQPAGNHSFNLDADNLKPGMYFYKLNVTGSSIYTQTKQMIISN